MPECKLDDNLLSQCDAQLSKCGRPLAPAGLSYVDIDFSFLQNVACPANGSVVNTLEITGPTEFRLLSISVVQSSPAFIRVQNPDGRFQQNILEALAPMAWAGSYRKAYPNGVSCQPGQKFRITTDVTKTTGAASSVALLFEGVYRFALRSEQPVGATTAGSLPRYYQSPNGNILAPEWMLDSKFAEIPAGYQQSEFRLVSPLSAVIATPGGQATLTMPLDSRYDYSIRRLTFEVALDPGVTGTLSVIPRDSSGFSLSTDYIPVALMNYMPWAHAWDIPGSLTMFYDFQFLNTSGAGNVTASVIAIGTRQKRAA